MITFLCEPLAMIQKAALPVLKGMLICFAHLSLTHFCPGMHDSGPSLTVIHRARLGLQGRWELLQILGTFTLLMLTAAEDAWTAYLDISEILSWHELGKMQGKNSAINQKQDKVLSLYPRHVVTHFVIFELLMRVRNFSDGPGGKGNRKQLEAEASCWKLSLCWFWKSLRVEWYIYLSDIVSFSLRKSPQFKHWLAPQPQLISHIWTRLSLLNINSTYHHKDTAHHFQSATLLLTDLSLMFCLNWDSVRSRV